MTVYDLPCPKCGAIIVSTARMLDDAKAPTNCANGHTFMRAEAFKKQATSEYYEAMKDLTGPRPIQIEAARRLKASDGSKWKQNINALGEGDLVNAFKTPSVEFLDKNHDKILKALDALRKWYKDNADKGMVSSIPLLMKAFDYDPYTKKVYRAFPLPKELIGKAVEGKTYKIKTGLKAVQSWTTSPKIAEDFINNQDYKTSDYGIFELKDAADQLCNYKWLRQVVTTLLKETKDVEDLYEIYMDSRQLMGFLDEFEHEQEVILKLPGESKVKLIKVLK